MTQFLELKPDRNLLDLNFEGYKLSLKSQDVIREDLELPISRKLLDLNQYSFLHAKIFGLHNFLFSEPNAPCESVYFVDNTGNLQKAQIVSLSNDFDVCTVFTIPFDEDCCENERYNVSLKFVSDDLVVLSNGTGSLYVLNTGDRRSDSEWQIEHVEHLLNSKGFVVQDAVLKGSELHVVTCRIEQSDKKAELAIQWKTLIKNGDTWNISASKELVSKGDVSYLYLEKNCEALYVASSAGCKFVFDSETPVTNEADDEKNVQKYKWSQDSEFVVVHFILPEEIKKEYVLISWESSNVKVEYKDSCLLNGMLFKEVDGDSTTVNVNKKLLEIMMLKKEIGATWDDLLIKEKLEQSTTEGVQHGITFNTEEIEECDFSSGDQTVFERLCGKTHRVTHKYNFGSNQVLLTVQTNEQLPPSLGIRHDVDVCFWEPQYHQGNFQLKHADTLLAFGYIQASKQQKKFLACPPDTSYCVICETSRHMFLYRQNSSVTSGELKNRKTGARIQKVAQQQVISIPQEEIFGIQAFSSGIYILGEKFLMFIKS